MVSSFFGRQGGQGMVRLQGLCFPVSWNVPVLPN